MSNKPEIALKMEEIEERGYLKTTNILTELKDFNEIPKENGIYMISTKTNAPLNVDYEVWYFCRVTVHNPTYLTQEAWLFATETTTMWIRTLHNGNWYEWGQVAKIYDIEDRAMTPKEPRTYGNDFNSFIKMGTYHIMNCQEMANKPPTNENVGLLMVHSGTLDSSLTKAQMFIPFNSTGVYLRTRGYGLSEWHEWNRLGTQKNCLLDKYVGSGEFDLNTATENGNYILSIEVDVKNLPRDIGERHSLNDHYFLRVENTSTGSACQTIELTNTAVYAPYSNRRFIRSKKFGEWTDWVELATTKTIMIQAEELKNGFSNWSNGYGDRAYLVKNGNHISFNGLIECGVKTNNTLIYTIPEEFRPNMSIIKNISCYPYGTATVEIQSIGNILVGNIPDSVRAISFGDISYDRGLGV